MTIDYDRRSLEAARFADREAAQDERPRWRRFRMTEAGEDIGHAYAYSREQAIYGVVLLRRRDSLSTSDIKATLADVYDDKRNCLDLTRRVV